MEKDLLQKLFWQSSHRMNEGLVRLDLPTEPCLLGNESIQNAPGFVDFGVEHRKLGKGGFEEGSNLSDFVVGWYEVSP